MASKHTWLLCLYFLWQLLRLLKLFSPSLTQQSGKPFSCYMMPEQASWSVIEQARCSWVCMYNLPHVQFTSVIVCLNDFFHLLWRIQTHCLLHSFAFFWFYTTPKWRLFALTSHNIIFNLSLSSYSIRTM